MSVGTGPQASDCLAVCQSYARHFPVVLYLDMSCERDPGSPLRVSRAREKEPKASLCPILFWLVLVSTALDEVVNRRLGTYQNAVPSHHSA